MKVKILGRGKVKKQSVAPRTKVKKNTVVTLEMG